MFHCRKTILFYNFYLDKVKQIVITNKQYLQTYSPPSKSAIVFETYTFKFRNLYGVFGACVE